MSTSREETNNRYYTYLKSLYELLGTDEHAAVNYMSIAKAAEIPSWNMINLKVLLEELGILKTRVEFNVVVAGTKRNGRTSFWQLVVPHDEADRRLREWSEKGLAWEFERRPGYVVKSPSKKRMAAIKATPEPKPEPTPEPKPVLAKRDSEETRAIAGPEPENPFESLRELRKDEPRALVEAARQYMNRSAAVIDEIHRLEKLGLKINHEAFMASIDLPKNDFLEAIATVVPYITLLENRVDRLGDQVADLKERTKDYADIKSSLERLRRKQQEEIAARVAASAR